MATQMPGEILENFPIHFSFTNCAFLYHEWQTRLDQDYVTGVILPMLKIIMNA